MPIACVLVKLSPFKFMSRMSDFEDYRFCFLQNSGKCMDFLKKKLVDDFLASRCTSLTTKSSHFVWSITSQNLNQFQIN